MQGYLNIIDMIKPNLKFKERPVFGEKDILSVLATGLVEGLQGLLDTTRLIHVLSPQKNGYISSNHLS